MRTQIRNPFTDLEPLSEIICPKCGHHNSGDTETCQICHRHLLIFCGHCGHPNYRSSSRCVECRTQLHIPWHNRWKAAKARKWVKPVEAVLLVVAVLLTVTGVIRVAEFDPPKREPQLPRVYVLRPDGTWDLK